LRALFRNVLPTQHNNNESFGAIDQRQVLLNVRGENEVLFVLGKNHLDPISQWAGKPHVTLRARDRG